MSISKRYRENFEKIDISKDYLLDDAIETITNLEIKKYFLNKLENKINELS